MLVDSERKLAVVEDETQRTDDRLRSGTDHVSSLEGKINDVGGEIRVLEDRDNDAAEREELTEEKLKVSWRNQGRRNFVKIGGGGPTLTTRHHGWRRTRKCLKFECSRSSEMAISESYPPPSVRSGNQAVHFYINIPTPYIYQRTNFL